MEIDRRNNFRLSEWAPEGGTPNSGETDSEGTETPILGTSSSELHNQFFNAIMKTYAKHKPSGILLQLLQQKYRSPELESQLEEPWLRDYKDNKCFLVYGLLYHREKHTSALTIVERDHISLILKELQDCPYMGHMRDKVLVSKLNFNNLKGPTKMRGSFVGPFTIIKLIGKNAGEVKLTKAFSRKHPVFPVSLVKPYFQREEDKFSSRKKVSACDSKPEHKHDSQNTVNQWYSQDTTEPWS
ncbi:hypothetical protein O181_084564 [Austropuccinia psidii MF-1]|uniref:Tf2-1-like SH3-like domain-containing protein n=1 Tax=Austropuccinia psidii MF-1 TaxID=1389203 RepID=A0A9Q3FTN6_9BASI|nr:hypothetical protein [Austropuccinia psidii MF-1]